MRFLAAASALQYCVVLGRRETSSTTLWRGEVFQQAVPSKRDKEIFGGVNANWAPVGRWNPVSHDFGGSAFGVVKSGLVKVPHQSSAETLVLPLGKTLLAALSQANLSSTPILQPHTQTSGGQGRARTSNIVWS